MVSRSRSRWCSVVIADAGAGLGRQLALEFAARGYIVFGMAISAEEVRDLKAASSGRVSLAVCDATRVDGFTTWAAGVSDALDGAGLDLLISNTFATSPAPLETLSAETVRRAFEVNVFSAMSIIKAFLSALRQSRGRIVQISHCATDCLRPFGGLQTATMAAVEVLASFHWRVTRSQAAMVCRPSADTATDSREQGTPTVAAPMGDHPDRTTSRLPRQPVGPAGQLTPRSGLGAAREVFMRHPQACDMPGAKTARAQPDGSCVPYNRIASAPPAEDPASPHALGMRRLHPGFSKLPAEPRQPILGVAFPATQFRVLAH